MRLVSVKTEIVEVIDVTVVCSRELTIYHFNEDVT